MQPESPPPPPHHHHSLLRSFLPHLDPHVAIALLDTLPKPHTPYTDTSILRTQYALFQHTQLYNDLQALASDLLTGDELTHTLTDYQTKQAALSQAHEQLLASEPVLKYTHTAATPEGKETLQRMWRERTLASAGAEAFAMSPRDLSHLHAFARTVYAYGQYAEARDVLRFLRGVSPGAYKYSEDTTWGLLGCDLLCARARRAGVKWQDAVNTFNVLQEGVVPAAGRGEGLPSVVRLLHYAVLLCLWSEMGSGREQLSELLLSEKYLGVVCAHVPYLLRYVVVAVLSSAQGSRARASSLRSHPSFRELLAVMESGSRLGDYTDPLLDCFHTLFVECDLERAVSGIGEIEKMLLADPCTCAYATEVTESLRRQIMEDMCRVREEVPLSFVSDTLGIAPGEVEKWTMGVLRVAKIKGKVLPEEKCVRLGHENTAPTASSLLVQKSKQLTMRLQTLYNTCREETRKPIEQEG